MYIKSLILAVALSLLPMSLFAEIVNINKADAATFQRYLKGVGEKKAQSIIEYRTDHKAFKRIDEIMEVRGIGKKIFNKIKENLSLTQGEFLIGKKISNKMSNKKKTVIETNSKEEVNIDSITENTATQTSLVKIETTESSKIEEMMTEE